MVANFQDILNVPVESIKPPRPLPVGTYLCLVDGPGEIKQLGPQQNWAVIFKFKPIQANVDVNQTELHDSLDGKALSEISLNSTFWITDKARYRLKDFLVDALGIDGTGKQLGELIPDAPGKQVNITVGHRPGDDGKAVYNEVKSYGRV